MQRPPGDPKMSLWLFVAFLLVPHPCQSPSKQYHGAAAALVEEIRITGLWTVISFYRKPFIYLFEEVEQPSLEP